MTYAVVSFLLGTVLGSRWRALALVPVSLLIVVVAMVAGVAAGEGIGQVALATMASVISLQAGYLVGAGLRVALFGVRTTQHVPAAAEPVLQGARKLRTDALS